MIQLILCSVSGAVTTLIFCLSEEGGGSKFYCSFILSLLSLELSNPPYSTSILFFNRAIIGTKTLVQRKAQANKVMVNTTKKTMIKTISNSSNLVGLNS